MQRTSAREIDRVVSLHADFPAPEGPIKRIFRVGRESSEEAMGEMMHLAQKAENVETSRRQDGIAPKKL